jgi:hypothetical protein
LLINAISTYVPAYAASAWRRNPLNSRQTAICLRVRGEQRLHAWGAAREICTSMAPPARLTLAHCGAVSPRLRRIVTIAAGQEDTPMPFWQRLLVTVVAMLVASFMAGLLWLAMFDAGLPSYLAGVVGGLAALPVWEFLKPRR